MGFRRIGQVCEYGWKDAVAISREEGVRKGRLIIYFDILYCFFRYGIWSNQYKTERLHLLSAKQKKEICLKYREVNAKRNAWVKDFFDNYKFLNKWSGFKYERSASLQSKRRAAYKKRYKLGEKCFIGYGVMIHRHHYSEERIKVGDNCQISEHVNIDFTGGLIIGNGVGLLDGVKILTHGHDYLGIKKKKDLLPNSKRAFLSPLAISDNVTIGSHALIMPGVRSIGENSIISAGSVVTKRVPENVIVAGNPAQVIGSLEGLNIYKRKP